MARRKNDDDDDELDVEEEEESLDEPKRTPRAKLSILTWVLIFLNWIAAGAFVYLLLMDYQVRQEWSYGVLRNHLWMRGLPLEDEEQSPGFHEALPRVRLDPDQVKEAFTSRGGRASGTFAAVDEPSRFQILPSHMTEQLQKDHFQGLDPPVATLNDEIKRLHATVPAEIKKAADAAAGKLTDAAAKRAAIETTLLPLAWDVHQVEKLHLRVRDAKDAKDAELDDLVSEAYQRRMYADILIPLNLYRPGDVDEKKAIVEKIADLDAYRIDNLKALLEKRIDATLAAKYDPEVHYGNLWQGAADRDSIEKRNQVAFLLFALSQARTPEKTLLLPRMLDRAQAVSGLYEFAIAAQNYVRTLRTQEERLIEAIRSDREGHVATTSKKELTRTAGFAERYNAEVLRLQDAVAQIDFHQKRLLDLQGQQKRFEAVLVDRKKHLEDIGTKLKVARTDTAKMLDEVRRLQNDLFIALKTLADAADRNFKLEDDIVRWEQKVKEGR